MTPLEELIEKRKTKSLYLKDYHILRFFSSFVAVSEGKVVEMTEPRMEYCPLVTLFYKNMRRSHEGGQEDLKSAVREIINEKIKQFGFFTKHRCLIQKDIAVRYGASEILMYALNKKHIEAAVVVCDGAGSVIVTTPEVVQGVGARMNGLFFTTPVEEVIAGLRKARSHVVFDDARIDQIWAAETACQKGYKNIAVTINASIIKEDFSAVKELERKYGAQITTLAVCTTGISRERALEIGKYADVVWGCASEDIRTVVGPRAVLQIAAKIPVYVLTAKGRDLVAAYSDQEKTIKDLDEKKQFFISDKAEGIKIKMGESRTYLMEAKLPVRSAREPR